MLVEYVWYMAFYTLRLGQFCHVMGRYMILASMTAITVNISTSPTFADNALYSCIIAEVAGLAVVVMGYSYYCADSMAVPTVAHCVNAAMGMRWYRLTIVKDRYIH